MIVGHGACSYTEGVTIDERLEKLAERHEALTQAVELMSRDLYAFQQKNEQRFSEIMEGIARLLHTAEIHERRLSDLEGGAR